MSKSFYRSRLFLGFVSLVISVFLWLFVTSGRERGISRDVMVSLEQHNLPQGLSLLGVPPQVEVRIAGTALQLSRLAPEDVHAFINLRNLRPGEYSLPVWAELPPTFELKEINPSEVQIHLTSIETGVFVPELKVLGAFSEGTSLEKGTLSPGEIAFQGPAEMVENLEGLRVAVSAEVLEEREKEQPLSLPVEPVLKSADIVGGVLSLTPPRVALEYRLLRHLEKRALTVHPVLKGDVSRDYRLGGTEITPSEVMLSGKPGTLGEILSVKTEELDITGAAGDKSFTASLLLPEGLAGRLSPSQVTVSVKVLPEMKEKVLREVALEVRGKSIYPRWEVFPKTITVYLQGPGTLLQRVESAEVTAFVDVTNLVSRKISVPIRVTLPLKGVRVIGSSPERATVYARVEE